MKRKCLFLCLLLIPLLLAGVAQAASDDLFSLPWNNHVSGAGGQASSPGYRVNLTVGQAAIGSAASPGYHVELGYWAGAGPGSESAFDHWLYLPAIQRVP